MNAARDAVLVAALALLAIAGATARGGLAAQGRGGAPGAAQVARGAGLILGAVVDGSTGEPIADATVTMTVRPSDAQPPARAAARGRGPLAGASALAMTDPGALIPGAERVLTDGQGRFVFHDLPKGTVSLVASAPGHVTAVYGQTRPSGRSQPIDLDEGERITDAKILLWKYAVMSGTIVDEAGEPAVNVVVRAFRRTVAGGRSRWTPGSQARTDDRGVFRLSTLVPGDFLVGVPETIATMPAPLMNSVIQGLASGSQGTAMADLVSSGVPAANLAGAVRIGDLLASSSSGTPLAPAADGSVEVYQTLFYPSAASPAQASAVTLASGEERSGLDFQLRLVPSVRVSGTVVTPDGVPGVLGVRLVPASLGDVAETTLEIGTAATAADGTFTFVGVPAGQYIAKVVKQPRPPVPAELQSSPIVQMLFGNAQAGSATSQMLYGQAAVDVGSADVTGVTLTLTPGAALSGQIQFQGNAPPPAPRQLQALTIVLSSADGTSSPAPGAPDHPDATGHFRTHGYPPGRYFVNLAGDAGSQWALQSIVAGGRDVVSEPLEIAGSDVTDAVVTFTDQITQISGIVRNDAGAAAPGAIVMLFPADYQSWLAAGMSPRRMRRLSTSKTGAYTAEGVLPGDYLAAAFDTASTNESDDAAFFGALARVATRVTLGSGDKKTMDLKVSGIK